MSNSIQGPHENVLKIVGRAVLTLHVHGESLSADKIASMIGCYAEDEPCDQEDRRLYALAMELMSNDKWAKTARQVGPFR